MHFPGQSQSKLRLSNLSILAFAMGLVIVSGCAGVRDQRDQWPRPGTLSERVEGFGRSSSRFVRGNTQSLGESVGMSIDRLGRNASDTGKWLTSTMPNRIGDRASQFGGTVATRTSNAFNQLGQDTSYFFDNVWRGLSLFR